MLYRDRGEGWDSDTPKSVRIALVLRAEHVQLSGSRSNAIGFAIDDVG